MKVKPWLAQLFINMRMNQLLQYFYLQVKQLENGDERIKLTNELLSGMKVMSSQLIKLAISPQVRVADLFFLKKVTF